MNGKRAWRNMAVAALGGWMAISIGESRADTPVNVTQHHNHLSRDGLYVDGFFTKSNAAALKRDTGFSGVINGNVFAQPLYVEGRPDGRAMVIAVTESNNVYALDAISGGILWQTNVGPPVAAGSLPCGNLSPYGITGTPVVDLASRALIVAAMVTQPGTGLVKQLVFSLNVDTGQINPGWPVDVGASATFGSTIFNPTTQGQRGALTVIGTNVYVPYGGLFGDCLTYYGWVIGIPLNNPGNVLAWATTAAGGGIWGVGGIASDGSDPFVTTGNTFGANNWGGGEAIVHLRPNLTLAGGNANYWAPANWSNLDAQDLDLGGSGPVLVEVPGATPSKLILALGKDGNAYLANRTNLGGISAPVAQAAEVSGSIIQAAATYQTALGTYVVFANANNLYSLRIGAANPPTITTAWTKSENGRGSPFVTSTDGTSNVVVWGLGAENDQRLHGFDGDTGATVFAGGGANELMAGTRRFNTGIAARGRIYVAGDNRVYAFRVPAQVSPFAVTQPAILPDGTFQISFTNAPGASFTIRVSTDVTVASTNWTAAGTATEIAPGQYQFADGPWPGNPGRYYRVTSP